MFSTEGGRVYAFGVGRKGRLGLGNEEPALSPAFVEKLRGFEVPPMATQDKLKIQSAILQTGADAKDTTGRDGEAFDMSAMRLKA